MYKKSLGLCCLLFSNLLMASDLYTQQFVLLNKTPYLKIKSPTPGREEGLPVGPTDATVIDNKFVVLDTYGSGVAYFDSNGALLKRISLPKEMQFFQNIARDRDNSLFVIGTDMERTMVVHIQNEVITEQTVYKTPHHFIDYIVSDDYGLVMKGVEVPAVNGNRDKLLEELPIAIQDRIDRDCISCEPKHVDGVLVEGLLYRISTGKKPSFYIGEKEVPLKISQKYKMNLYEILQVDQDGTAWIENFIMSDGPSITYVWKVSKLGKILGIYRFASDGESSSTEWPMQHQIVVSNDGKVYGIISDKQHFKFIKLKQLSVEEMKHRAKYLDSVLFKKKDFKPKITNKMSELEPEEVTTLGCRSWQKAIDDAYAYLNNKIYLSTSSIKNSATCPNRIIPPYLSQGQPQTYDSVSYNWGGFDTVAEFNKKIATNKMKAGNVNDKSSPLLSCAAGVDCSGYVSRAWGLTSKLGTRDIASSKITEEIDWREIKTGDVFIVPGVHVMIFRMKSDMFGKIAVIEESNSEAGRVIEQRLPIEWLKKYNYQPRRAKSNIICKD